MSEGDEMVKTIFVCCGSKGPAHDLTHPPVEFQVDKNGVDVFLIKDKLVLTEGYGWMDLAKKMGIEVDFRILREKIMMEGGDYHGSGDRLICPICGARIVWRI